jgi:hypothetical protein
MSIPENMLFQARSEHECEGCQLAERIAKRSIRPPIFGKSILIYQQEWVCQAKDNQN